MGSLDRTIHTQSPSSPLAIALTILVLLLSPGAGAAQVEGSSPFEVAGTSAEDVASFLKALQSAVAKDDREAVAKRIAYPVRVNAEGGSELVASRRHFLRLYPRLFPEDLKRALAAATVDSLFANWQGVMLEDGWIWFSPDEEGALKIIAFNPPAGTEER